MGLDVLLIEGDAHRCVAVARHLARRNMRVTISRATAVAPPIPAAIPRVPAPRIVLGSD